jgi:hypothetical protein
MALACATATVTEPDLAPRPETPREQQPAEQSWDDPLAELTRIVGRENPERGDELLALFRERGLAPQVQEFRTEATERSPSQVDDRSFQAAGIPNVSLAMNGTTEAHQMWLALNAGPESGLREGFVPAVFRVIHTSKDTIERVTEGAMNRLHDVVVALVLELDKTLE